MLVLIASSLRFSRLLKVHNNRFQPSRLAFSLFVFFCLLFCSFVWRLYTKMSLCLRWRTKKRTHSPRQQSSPSGDYILALSSRRSEWRTGEGKKKRKDEEDDFGEAGSSMMSSSSSSSSSFFDYDDCVSVRRPSSRQREQKWMRT